MSYIAIGGQKYTLVYAEVLPRLKSARLDADALIYFVDPDELPGATCPSMLPVLMTCRRPFLVSESYPGTCAAALKNHVYFDIPLRVNTIEFAHTRTPAIIKVGLSLYYPEHSCELINDEAMEHHWQDWCRCWLLRLIERAKVYHNKQELLWPT